MKDVGAMWWGHTGWVARPREDRLGSVVWTQGTAQTCWGRAGRRHSGPEPGVLLAGGPDTTGQPGL